MGQMRVRRTGPWVKISCPFSWVQFIPRVGQGVGQAVDPHFDPHHFQRFCNKKASKTEVFDAFCRVLTEKMQEQSLVSQGFAGF